MHALGDFILAQDGVEHIGVHPAGGVAVDAHAVAAIFIGRVHGHAHDGKLTGTIANLQLVAAHTRAGARIDDRAAVLRLHDRQAILHGQERAEDVDAVDLLEVGKRVVLHALARARDAGHVGQNIHRAEHLVDLGNGRFDLLLVTDIHGHGIAVVGTDLSRRPKTTTIFAPSAARRLATAAPMPLPPPVTMATLP